MHQVGCTKYPVSCYLWQIGPALKVMEFQNIMTGVAWKFFFALCTSTGNSNFQKKWSFCSKKLFLSKTTIKEGWNLSKVKFWPKPNMQKSAYTKPLNLKLYRNWLAFYVFIKD